MLTCAQCDGFLEVLEHAVVLRTTFADVDSTTGRLVVYKTDMEVKDIVDIVVQCTVNRNHNPGDWEVDGDENGKDILVAYREAVK